MFRHLKIFIALVTLVSFQTGTFGQFYNGSRLPYAKNRVQHKYFNWRQYDFEDFTIYFYEDEDELAEYTAKFTNYYLKEIAAKYDFLLNERIDIILFESYEDYKQSNLGLLGTEDSEIMGKARIYGEKAFVYYTGDHASFEIELKKSISEIYLYKMLFGGSWKDVLKANLISDFPDWFTYGFVSYMSEDWDSKLDSKVKDAVLTGQFDEFRNLEGEMATLAGHAIWNYIAEAYGKEVLSNILYTTRVSKNAEKGFKYILGLDFERLTKQFIDYYKARYFKDIPLQMEPAGEQLNIKGKAKRNHLRAEISPDGSKVAYVTNQLGKIRIHVLDLKTGKETIIWNKNPKVVRIQDYNNIALAWHPSGDMLSYFLERKGFAWHHIYDFETNKTEKLILQNVQTVLWADYSPDGQQVVLSAAEKGQTDLYLLYLAGNAVSRLTNDVFDYLHPSFTQDGSSVVFTSNRTTDTIRTVMMPEIRLYNTNCDIFMMKLSDAKKIKIPLKRITRTPGISETYPKVIGKETYAYLSDVNGIKNRYIIKRDSIISSVDSIVHYRYTTETYAATNYVTNILGHSFSGNDVLNLVFQNNKFKLFINPIELSNPNLDLKPTGFVKLFNKLNPDKAKQTEKERLKEEEESFEYEFEEDGTKQEIDTSKHYQKRTTIIGENHKNEDLMAIEDQRSSGDLDEYIEPKKINYRLNFARDQTSVKLDNNWLNASYQRYNGPGSVYFNSGLSAFLTAGISDVFEDYKVLGAIKLPFDGNSGEQLLMIDILKRRLDHKIAYYRSTQRSYAGADLVKWYTNEAKYRMSYPISEVLAWQNTFNIRYDREVKQSISENSLRAANNYYLNGGVKTALVFDNTISMGENSRRGLRWMVWGEYLQEGYNSFQETQDFDQMAVLGGDIRYYLRIHRNLIWVNRFAASTSLGSQQLLYYMGAVDGWTFRSSPDFNEDVEVDPNVPFSYQTVGTPVRGFIQNIRNGNSMGVYNTEIRWPLFTYFSKKPLQSSFMKTFEIVGFFDMATAWTGPHPWSPDNYFNTQNINDYPVTVSVLNQRDPIVFGTGFGARAKILGYFMRLDFAWGIEDRNVNPMVVYFSLEYDI